jgi:hypothetical protein
MTLSGTDWIAIATIALPLIAKVLSDISTNREVAHNAALARITGMAAREAATIARDLAALPAGVEPEAAERVMISDAAKRVQSEMLKSGSVTGADAAKLGTIVQGELNKLVVNKLVLASPATITPTPSKVLAT